MNRIGFIDLSIDEWHANNYPAWIRASKRSEPFEVTLAWEESPSTETGARYLEQWCDELSVKPAGSVEEVVRECDYLVVLSPNNPEAHRRLADLPLKSGKPVYVDKTFAPDLATARELFDLAKAHGTPLFSSSALRFTPALRSALEGIRGSAIRGTRRSPVIEYVCTAGGKNFNNYLVHQVEIVVTALGTGAREVRYGETKRVQTVQILYSDGRLAQVAVIPDHPFQVTLVPDRGEPLALNNLTDFFPAFIECMLDFFTSRVSPVPTEETLEIMAILEAARLAQQRPDRWVPVYP